MKAILEEIFYPLEMCVLYHTRTAAVLAIIGASTMAKWVLSLLKP